MDKNAKITLSFILVFVIAAFFLINYLSLNVVLAKHLVNVSNGVNRTTGGVTFNVNEDVGYIYNITINNTDVVTADTPENITNVTIILPQGFTYVPGLGIMNGTDASAPFRNTTALILEIYNATSVINGSTGLSSIKSFWFNATVATPGNYTIQVLTTNSSSTITRNLLVIVNDTTAPTVTLISPANLDRSRLDSTLNTFTFNVTDNRVDSAAGIESCILVVDSVVSGNKSTNINITGANINFRADVAYNTNHTWNVTCIDNNGNYGNSSSLNFTILGPLVVDTSAGGGSSSSGGGTTPTTPTWTATQALTNDQFASGYSKDLGAKNRVSFTIGSTTHSVGVVSLTATTANIQIASTPQTATFNIGDVKKFDINGDGTYDVSVTLNSITNGLANVTVKSINEPVPVTPTNETAPITPPTTSSSMSFWVWAIIIIVVIVLIIIIYFSYSKKRYYKKGY